MLLRFFNVFVTEIRKVLLKIANLKDCNELAEWIKACENDLHWSATSTPNGNGDVIWAKFSSFVHHIINEHDQFENQLFNRCAHEEDITDRKWLTKGRF